MKNYMLLLFMGKILLYIFFVVVIFYFVQDRFDIFDISFNGEEEKIVEESNDESKTEGNRVEIYNKDGDSLVVDVDVADDAPERSQGLSGRSVLGDYEGMLFIMPNEGFHGFWMKDMLISLDFLFIDTEGFIIDIKENVVPCGGVGVCPAFSASSPFKYVIELNSGFIQNNRIEVGNSVVFKISSNL
jgi:uncharacterized membrane protein (UPF0127 family)